MSEEIRQIAERLVGLRDALDLRPEDIASTCNIDLETYLGYESGEKDIPVSFLHQIAKHYGVELPALMFGYEPRMNSYFLTRKDKGVAVERTKAYKYQSLAAGFANRKADPFMVTLEIAGADQDPAALSATESATESAAETAAKSAAEVAATDTTAQ